MYPDLHVYGPYQAPASYGICTPLALGRYGELNAYCPLLGHYTVLNAYCPHPSYQLCPLETYRYSTTPRPHLS